jgi:hypothetical protein
MRKNKHVFSALLVLTLTLNSCIGISMDINMNTDGSGKINLEYRVSRLLDSLGAFDGNQSMPVIPVGLQDWQRTVDRIPGLKIASFKTAENNNDFVTNLVLNYENPQALVMFLGENSFIDMDKRQLEYIIKSDIEDIDDNLKMMMRNIFIDYNFSISFSASGNSAITIIDKNGNTVIPPSQAEVTSSGRKTSFSINTMDLIELPTILGLRFNW